MKFDKTIDERQSDKALGALWTSTQQFLQDEGKWTTGMKLIRSGNLVSLYLIHDEEAWELFALKRHTSISAASDVTLNAENLLKYGIDEAVAKAWIEQAVSAAGRFFTRA